VYYTGKADSVAKKKGFAAANERRANKNLSLGIFTWMPKRRPREVGKVIEERVISIIKLPDGGFAVQNERDVSGLTEQDENEMAYALILWFDLRNRVRRETR
jgi:hypothetical protein